jgi:hypothetical protein
MAGVDKTLEVFQDLSGLAVSGVKIAKTFKNGIGVSAILGSIGQLVQLGKSVDELIKDLPAALPELADLDGVECAKIGAAAYDLVKKGLVAVKEA